MSEARVYWAVTRDSTAPWLKAPNHWVRRGERALFATRDAALTAAGIVASENVGVRLVKVTIRKRPASPPPLKRGDEVLVRGRVSSIDRFDPKFTVRVEFVDGAESSWVRDQDIVRATKESK